MTSLTLPAIESELKRLMAAKNKPLKFEAFVAYDIARELVALRVQFTKKCDVKVCASLVDESELFMSMPEFSQRFCVPLVELLVASETE